MECDVCNKKFNSKSYLIYHKKEKHTFINCERIICELCEIEFNRPVSNKNNPNKNLKKCEECRDLQNKLKTNNLKNGTFCYDTEFNRVKMNKNSIIKMCKIYDCDREYPCDLHNSVKKCINKSCNNFDYTDDSMCRRCRIKEDQFKNKYRRSLKEFKEDLGGECKNCGLKDMFFLEFDHIDPSTKQRQITRTSSKNFHIEKDNIQLLCGICHRIKSLKEMDAKFKYDENNKHKRCKKDKKDFVLKIKREIGSCQVCGWTHENDQIFSYATDFDHISNDKYRQVSSLYHYSKETIKKEIDKCRLLCRHCHQLNTCIQRGSKMLNFYYTPEEIQELKQKN
jgi:hypothetical protein